MGAKASALGQLTFVREGRREYSAFYYASEWLRSHDRFEVSPDLPLREGVVTRRAPSTLDSPLPFALADTAPDAWGRESSAVRTRSVAPKTRLLRR